MKRYVSLAMFLMFFTLYGFTYSVKLPIKWGKVAKSEFEIKSFRGDTSVDAIILCDFGDIKITNRTFYTRHVRIKILNDGGLKYANVEIPYQARNKHDDIITLKAQAFNLENGEIIKIEGKDLFLKNGFKSVASIKPSFELMVKTFKKGAEPKVNDWEAKLKKYKGLNILYTNQCPWVARFIHELDEIMKKKDLKLKVTEIKTAKDAQNAPSLYASFNLIYNGKLLADHYISSRRFENILKKEVE